VPAIALLVHGAFGFQSARCRTRALFFGTSSWRAEFLFELFNTVET